MDNGLKHQLHHEIGEMQLRIGDLERRLEQYQHAAELSIARKQEASDIPEAVIAYNSFVLAAKAESYIAPVLPKNDLGIVIIHAMDGNFCYVSSTVYPVLVGHLPHSLPLPTE